MAKQPKVHFRRGSVRTRCGIPISKSKRDTRDKSRVTCQRCLRALLSEAVRIIRNG